MLYFLANVDEIKAIKKNFLIYGSISFCGMMVSGCDSHSLHWRNDNLLLIVAPFHPIVKSTDDKNTPFEPLKYSVHIRFRGILAKKNLPISQNYPLCYYALVDFYHFHRLIFF
jgi:hypothetical protein